MSKTIELPCYVGDTVYFAEEYYREEAEIEEIRIDKNGIMFCWVQYDVGVDITEVWDEGEFIIEDIGKKSVLNKRRKGTGIERR